jgi:uncharacterized protein (TIGR00251 family)
MEPAIREGKRGVTMSVHVVPRASRDEVIGVESDGAVRVRLHAPPVEGAANAALIAFLADILALPQRQVEIVSGLSSRHKTVAITGVSRQAIQAKLSTALAATR